MKHRQMTKSDVVAGLAMKKYLMLGNRVSLMIVICILNDVYEWSPEKIGEFLDKYYEFLDSYNRGEEDLDAIMAYIKENTGVDILAPIEVGK